MPGLVPGIHAVISGAERRGYPAQGHGCPAYFVLWECAWRCIYSWMDVAKRSGHEVRVSAMRHQNSVFHQLLKHLPWEEFDALARAHRADARARRLTTKSHFLALLYGQLAGAASLREIVGGIESQRARLYHLGAKLPRRATLADANRARPADFFAALLALMIGRAHRGNFAPR